MTIIIVAISLDALLNIFETAEEDRAGLVYPVLLLAAAVLALVGLGIFHYLSRSPATSHPRSDRADQ